MDPRSPNTPAGRAAALSYAKAHLGPHAARGHMPDIQRLMGCLLFVGAGAGGGGGGGGKEQVGSLGWDARSRDWGWETGRGLRCLAGHSSRFRPGAPDAAAAMPLCRMANALVGVP